MLTYIHISYFNPMTLYWKFVLLTKQNQAFKRAGVSLWYDDCMSSNDIEKAILPPVKGGSFAGQKHASCPFTCNSSNSCHNLNTENTCDYSAFNKPQQIK